MKSRTIGSLIGCCALAIGAVALVCWPSASIEAVYPVENAKRAVAQGFLTRFSGLFRGAAAQAENVRLRREVAVLSLLRGEVGRLEAENARLRRTLGYVSKPSREWVAAGILSRDGGAAGTRDVLRVSKGSLAGIVRGAIVVVPEGLVGRVTAVTPHTAEVLLVTDPSFRVACKVEAGSSVRATGIVSGGGGDRLVLRYLRQVEDIPPRARVLTSGLGGVFPPGLEVGTLLDIRRDPRGLVREGEVLPRVDFSTLEDVFIRREK